MVMKPIGSVPLLYPDQKREWIKREKKRETDGLGASEKNPGIRNFIGQFGKL